MPATRLFRFAILAEAVLFFAHLVTSLVGFDQLPLPIRDEATRAVMEDLDGSVKRFGVSLLEFFFLLTALAGLYFYARFARWLWWIALTVSAIELVVQPFISEAGWISMIGGLSYAGYGVITGLLWHPEIRARFKDHSTVGRRRLKIAFGVAGIIALLTGGTAYWLGIQLLSKLPPGKPTPIARDITLNQSSAPNEIQAELDRIAETFLATPANAGIAIGVTRGKGSPRIFTARGVLSKKGIGADPVTADTLFEIGSVSKTFTALLTAEAVADGVIQLEQPVSGVFGDEVELPAVEQTPITFLDLATHHSSFPRMPNNLGVWRQFSPNPYASFSEADLFAAVSSLGDTNENGDPRRRRYRYSNLGYSLLLRAVARARGQSPADLHADLFSRLGLTNTYFTHVDDEAIDRLANGHNRGLSVSHWHDGGALIQGGGSIVSSVSDQLTWLEAHIDPPEGSLGEAVELAATPRLPTQTENIRIGLAWHFTGRKSPIIWHNGATGGFRSIILWLPEPGLGVAVLANSSDDAVDRIGLLLMRALQQREKPGKDEESG